MVFPTGSSELGWLPFSIVDTFSDDLDDTGPFFNVPFFFNVPIERGGARPEVGVLGAEPGFVSLLTGAASLDVGFFSPNPLGLTTGLAMMISSSASSTGSSSGDSLLVC